MKWTDQQDNAINIRNASVIVSAAAGSGKTAVLTERLSQLIADRSANVRADRIIVVTFTNDAASELRKRLDIRLRAMISEDPGNSYLLRQQILLQSARISTINAFCFELLRNNITDQGITSAFTVLDDNENKLIKDRAMDELINYYSSQDYEKISCLYDKFCMKDDEELAKVINIADNFLSSTAMRDRWLERAAAEYEKSPEESVYFRKLIENAEEITGGALRLAKRCSEMLDDIFMDTGDRPCVEKSYIVAENDVNRVEKLLDIFKSGRIPDESEIAYCTSFDRMPSVGKNEEFDSEKRNIYKKQRDNFKGAVKSAIGIFDDFERDFCESREVTLILCEMLKKYQELIWKQKCEKNAISFDDGERLALELLADFDSEGRIIPSETAENIADYYDIIMIDEYQDSNNKQDMIFKLLSKNCRTGADGAPMYGNNAFLVGDVKQSIYKFRLANPENFINTMKNSVPYSKTEKAENVSIALNQNFRSSPGVIDYVNFVFSQLMSEKCGDVNYSGDEMLYFGAADYEGKDLDYTTSIALINCDEPDDDDDETPVTYNAEAEYTAGKIYSMIKNKTQVMEKNGSIRPCQPSDFCILIQKNKYSEAFISALKKYDIEAKGEETSGYLSSREISVLLDLLRIIDNPLLDVPMAAVMMSPMFMFELEEIAFLRTLNRNAKLYTVISDIVRGKYSDKADMFFKRRCEDFLVSLNSFRLNSITMTVGELISSIYDTTDFIAVMQIGSDGERKRANLRALIQYAKAYEDSSSFEGAGGLAGFIRYIDRITENGADLTQAKISSATGNYVSVKTIHKSKGLEYPFIFLAENSSKPKADSSAVLCTDEGCIGYILNDPELVRRYRTCFYKQIKDKNEREQLSEKMRLLYVALTRARQKLFINLKVNDEKIKWLKKLLEKNWITGGNIKELVCNMKTFDEWIWISMLNHEKFSEIMKMLDISNDSFDYPSVKFRGELFTVERADTVEYDEENRAEQEESETSPDMRKYNELRDILDFKYDDFLSKTPSKLSVTQISRKFSGDEESFDFKLKRPAFAGEKKELTGAEKGTAIHTLFQYCNFNDIQSDAEKEIDNMISRGFLSKAQADSISRENVSAFFRSSLYKRISSSENVWREKKFMVALAELDIHNEFMDSFRKSDGMIKGIVDLLFEENGQLILVDYKSDRRCSADELSRRYQMQIQLYKSAMELTTGKKVAGAYLYSFELQREIEIKL